VLGLIADCKDQTLTVLSFKSLNYHEIISHTNKKNEVFCLNAEFAMTN
jgi:hypothetical protein